MPKVKSGLNYEKNYSEEQLKKAVQAVNNGMSKKKASATFGVPRSTIQFRINNPPAKNRHGPPPILTPAEEDSLKQWIFESCKRGFPRRMEDVQCSVKQFLDESPRENPFKDNYPGIGWYKAFLKRHVDITSRTSEGVTSASSKVTEENIRNWFNNIHQYLVENSLNDILQDATRIYNGDETGFQLCPQNRKVLAPKGIRNVYEIDVGKAKTQITVMFTFGASGEVTPPMIIYPYKRLPAAVAASVPKDWGIGLSDTGWMKSEVFYEYIGNVLHPALVKMKIKFPIILIVDGHRTHLDRNLSELCNRLQIILIALYPNATRILQPADVSAFRPIKNNWKTGVLAWRREHPAEELTKEVFANILEKVVNSIKSTTLVNGFRTCGLFPWNPDSIDYSKCLGKAPERTTTEPQAHHDTRTINYSTFKKIVGHETIGNFKNLDKANIMLDENVLKLYRLWEEFFVDETIDETHKEPNFDRTDNEFIDEFLSSIPVITEEEYTKMKDESNNNNILMNETEDMNIISEEIKLSLTDNLPEVTTEDIEKVPIADDEFETNFTRDSYLSTSELINDAESKLEETLTCPPSPPKIIIHRVENLQLPSIRTFLHYPEAPKRKGREIEKMPFVITSENWQRKTREKEEKKNKEQEEKENRKRQRLLKKENTKKLNETKKITKAKAKIQKVKQMPKKKTNAKIFKPLIEVIPNATNELLNAGENTLTDHSVIREAKIDLNAEKNILKNEEEKDTDTDYSACYSGNTRLITGLCYICTNNISTLSSGIKCFYCNRSYYVRCLKKKASS
jgi:hypothetical protein